LTTAQRDGLLLAASAVIGMLLMNSAWSVSFQHLLEQPISLGIGPWVLSKPVELWINDFLMAIFFMVVGIEIKHEWNHGALATAQARILPFGAALGGMAVPALIYSAINASEPPNLAGWAIPAATDIAFALGLMALAAPRTRPALLAFLTAVAVLDDLGAIVVIALFYTDRISPQMLIFAAIGATTLIAMARLRVQRLWPYLAVGVFLWVCVLKSGVHATLAGVLLGLCLPSRSGESSPARRTEHAVKPWVSWVILPLFGVVNAGVSLQGFRLDALAHPVTLGVAAGLVAGKPLGILAGTWLASRLGGGLPAGYCLRDYLSVACFCGIGFTMALFIGTLAFEPGSAQANSAKLGVLTGTLLAFTVGTLLARLTDRTQPSA
jgi:NhaA family Na+:H+ antiporter